MLVSREGLVSCLEDAPILNQPTAQYCRVGLKVLVLCFDVHLILNPVAEDRTTIFVLLKSVAEIFHPCVIPAARSVREAYPDGQRSVD